MVEIDEDDTVVEVEDVVAVVEVEEIVVTVEDVVAAVEVEEVVVVVAVVDAVVAVAVVDVVDEVSAADNSLKTEEAEAARASMSGRASAFEEVDVSAADGTPEEETFETTSYRPYLFLFAWALSK